MREQFLENIQKVIRLTSIILCGSDVSRTGNKYLIISTDTGVVSTSAQGNWTDS